uniref:FCF1 rRNA-processing protein n=1 Tax=Hucho hucho TaxID=62062 RepID=A0A4W5QLA4_9TELE
MKRMISLKDQRISVNDGLPVPETQLINPIKIAKDPRFERLVTQNKCYILATVDRDLKRRIRKIPGVPIMYISNHRFNIERMPDDYGAPRF